MVSKDLKESGRGLFQGIIMDLEIKENKQRSQLGRLATWYRFKPDITEIQV
jgi:hypothetical protein